MKQRTAHTSQRTAQGSQAVGRPYIQPGESNRTVPGRAAEHADMRDRQAWASAGVKHKSSYAHMINIPDRVAPGDKAIASRILGEVYVAINKGGWTSSEWRRLRALEEKWKLRALGVDVGFMLRGWKKQGDGKHTPKMEKMFKTLKQEIRDVDFRTKHREDDKTGW